VTRASVSRHTVERSQRSLEITWTVQRKIEGLAGLSITVTP
jgi:hypothetical protein